MKFTADELEKVVNEVKQEILEVLPAEIPFTLKIKEFSRENWCALYRGGTFTRSGRAIVWINNHFPEMVAKVEGSLISEKSDLEYSIRKNLLDTISHELIHAVQEAVYFAENNKLIGNYYDEDEAETLGLRLASGDSIESSPLIQKYIKYYCS